jgi:hypothetical protein
VDLHEIYLYMLKLLQLEKHSQVREGVRDSFEFEYFVEYEAVFEGTHLRNTTGGKGVCRTIEGLV